MVLHSAMRKSKYRRKIKWRLLSGQTQIDTLGVRFMQIGNMESETELAHTVCAYAKTYSPDRGVRYSSDKH